MAKQTKPRSMTTDEATETEVSPKTHLQLPIIAVGVAKDNKVKISELTTLTLHYFAISLL